MYNLLPMLYDGGTATGLIVIFRLGVNHVFGR
jgi:hypothetical protein